MREAPLSSVGTRLALGDVRAATSGQVLSGHPEKPLEGVSIDSRTLRPGELFVAIVGPRFDGHDFLLEATERGAAAALVHRDVAPPPGLDLVRVKDTTKALADLARHVRLGAPVPIVAITGSTGKTTTKEMTAALLEGRGPVLRTKGNLNNRYGVPLTLLRLKGEHTAAVLELGVSAPGELRALAGIARPDVALITNVAPVHLEFFDSVDAIAKAKAEILEGLPPDGIAILNGDDHRLWRLGERHRGRVIFFGKDRSWDVSAENWRSTISGMRFDLRAEETVVDVALPLSGPHFMMDFLAAAAAALHLGVKPEDIVERARDLKAASHRGEMLHLGENVTLIDDSYNSNPVALDAAVAALSLAGAGRRVAFLGDMLELGAAASVLHREAGERLKGSVDVLVGVGSFAEELLRGAERSGLPKEALVAFPNSSEAARAATRIVQPGDRVLVKGSRGVCMERVVEALMARWGGPQGNS